MSGTLARSLGALGDAIGGTANANFDAGTLFVDGTNNRVGVVSTSALGNSRLNVDLGIVARTEAASGNAPYLQLFNGNAGTDLKTWRLGATSTGALAIETVNDAYSSSTQRMLIDASGRVTRPAQPCFTAYGGTNFTTTGSQQTVIFTTVPVNVGSCYSASTGRFTAPVAGNYFFTCNFVQMGTATGPSAYLLKNGNQVSSPAIGYSDAYATASISAIISLAVNDYVNIGIIAFNSSFSTIDLAWSGFSGFLMG